MTRTTELTEINLSEFNLSKVTSLEVFEHVYIPDLRGFYAFDYCIN